MNIHFTLGLVRSLFSNHRNHKKFLYSLRLDVKALEHLLNVTHGKAIFSFRNRVNTPVKEFSRSGPWSKCFFSDSFS